MTATRASQVTNVAQQPFLEKPPTRSPTWWSATSGPTAVTTPTKSTPSSGSTLVDGGESAHGHEHIREVQAGCRDRDLDLSWPRRNAVDCNQFHRFQVTGGADSQAHTAFRVIDDSGVPLVGTQRTRTQARRIPLPVAPRRLVFVQAAEQFSRQLLGVGVVVHIDLGDAQVRVFRADHPQQATQSRLLQVDLARRPDELRLAGHDEQAR